MTDTDKMMFAIEEAKKAFNEGEVPVGAALFKNDILIATAHNLCVATSDPTAHAELIVLQKAVKQLGVLKDCTLYVTLEPCAMCAGAIINTKLDNLVFGAYNKEGCCGSLIDLTDHWCLHSCRTIGGFMKEQCSALLSEFFKNKH